MDEIEEKKMKNPSRQNGSMCRKISTAALDAALSIGPIRRWAISQGNKKIYDFFVIKNADHINCRVQEMRWKITTNLLHQLDRAQSEGRLSSKARKGFLRVFIGQVMTGEAERMRPFKEIYGFEPPSFLTISPTQKCNLQCHGCYAMSSSNHQATLPYDIFSRIIKDKKEQWGSHLTIISGGEPFLYRSEGKGLLDIAREFNDCYFMTYTNGTLIDDEMAAKLADLGNISPAISIEGWEKETDARRGKGIFKKIETAMDALRRHGVVFGISMTATRQNAEVLLSDELLKRLFDEKGAIYAWIFQYMPIGRSSALDLMITPEQRKWMLQRESDLMFKEKRFLIDFWNGGPLSAGCISAGRAGGYFYIDWNGNISPCVFFPYYVDNILEVYQSNRSLSSALSNPLFQSIRAWQQEYRCNGTREKTHNLYVPCPIRDHYEFAHDAILRHKAQPMDSSAACALDDKAYHAGMVECGKKTAELLNPIWEKDIYNKR
jgi:MoaA/NifB/PqqE/SkfB family radical SAM enzyme